MGKKKEVFGVIFMLLIIVLVTGGVYLKHGLYGYPPDLYYHLLRVEGVKESLLQGVYPVRIYENFFNGYGYGSPLFYPDLFLIIPAVLRILGCSLSMAWKVFALLIVIAATLSTFFSFRYIIGNWKYAMVGTFLLMLSQFYLADLLLRVGISEYLAYVFLPLLIAGIYDFFEKNGKKTWLMGIAFTGLVLSHTIMTFIGFVVTVAVFVFMFFHKSKRPIFLDKKRMGGLLGTAVLTILAVSYYLFPMLEQMLAVDYKYSTTTIFVGNFIQPFQVFFRPTGYFNIIAYVGIGIPILMLVLCRFIYKRPQNRWADYFYFGGGLLFLLTTAVFPWRLLNHTIFNMIQFTYRLYPHALCFLILGICMILNENLESAQVKRFQCVIIMVTVFFGMWQNYTVIRDWEELYNGNLSVDSLAEHNNSVGQGEWLPVVIDPAVVDLQAEGRVLAGEKQFETERKGGEVLFSSIGSLPVEYNVPLIYYKGYEARLIDKNGEEHSLLVQEADNGLVEVINNSGFEGTVRVFYQNTKIQTVSTWVSALTIMGLVIQKTLSSRRKRKKISNG